jgi:hypothetical protein
MIIIFLKKNLIKKIKLLNDKTKKNTKNTILTNYYFMNMTKAI